MKFSTVDEMRNLDKIAAEDLNFEAVNIDYSQYTSDNFIILDC